MKHSLAAAVCLFLAMVPSAPPAQPLAHPFEIAEQVFGVFEKEGEEGVFRFLENRVRQARAQGALTPEWSVVFMMLADSARNTRENSAYALRIADEGLELARSGTDEDRDMAVMLEVSRAYSLADLGRFDEAASAAVMALPAFRETFGDETADDLKMAAESWTKGELTADNFAAETVAAKVLAEAEAAFGRGEYGTMLTLAARAALPENAGISPDILARSNAHAGLLRGQALYLLGQMPAAYAALTAAADLAAPGWAAGQPDWQFDADAAAPLPADLFFWLGRTAVSVDKPEEAQIALALADTMTTAPRARNTLLFARAGLMEAMGQADAAIEALKAASRSTDPELTDQAALAGFYAELLRARQARTVAELAPDDLFAAAEAAIAQDRPGSAVSASFVQGEAALYLLFAGQTERALDYARAAFAAGQERLQNSRDSDAGTLAARRAARDLIETYLDSAHLADSAQPGAICPEADGLGCVVITP